MVRLTYPSFLPQVEFILKEKIGLEFGLEYDFSPVYLLDLSGISIRSYRYSNHTLSPGISGKYYFLLNRKNGNGFYAGPLVQMEFLIHQDKAYAEKWEELRSQSATYSNNGDSLGSKKIKYGIVGGYKFLLKSNISIEPGFNWYVEHDLRKDEARLYSPYFVQSELILKVGYRFSNTEESLNESRM